MKVFSLGADIGLKGIRSSDRNEFLDLESIMVRELTSF